jgi:hypothetical protein
MLLTVRGIRAISDQTMTVTPASPRNGGDIARDCRVFAPATDLFYILNASFCCKVAT